MSKRITVFVDQNLFNLIDFYCKNEDISVAAFARKIGKHNRWVSEVKRGRNLPSPEEAARMCILLNTTPEEILLHEGKDEKETAKCQKDIELVRKLLEKEKGIKETPDPKIEGYSELQKAAIQFVLSLPPEKLRKFIKLAQAVFEDEQHD